MPNLKIVLITGATSGFGAATAKLLAQTGNYRLILVGRRKARLEALQKSLKSEVLIRQLDVTDKQAVAKFYQTLPEEYKQIDVLINSAGLAVGMDLAFEAKLEDWEAMIETNNKGLLYCTYFALQIMKERNSGLIINLGSVAGTVPYPRGNVYGATKAFVRQFSRNLRADLAGTAIKVSNIEPGMAETEFSIVRYKGDEEKAQAVYANTNALQAEDIAHTIKWIIEQPAHVNIDSIEIMPVDQTFAGMVINRKQN